MTKPICVIQAPFGTRSGYGDMARDIIRHIIELDRYDVKLISTPWGATPVNALSESNPKDQEIIKHIIPQPPQLPRQPELFIQVSVPNEFQPVGKYNIGITAGIETTLCSGEWIQGMNRMDLILTISEHAKNILANTTLNESVNGQPTGRTLKLEKPIEVLHNCVDTSIFHKLEPDAIPSTINNVMDIIDEDFCFLFVGHWLKGNLGEDRKNVGVLIRTFCEAFKHKAPQNRPALILKTSGAGFSLLDRQDILKKIKMVREMTGKDAPNVYLLHGDLSEPEMNGLYNHPKVKIHISFTKGEGFGRPLLEASMSRKPVMASGWSGHLDFLNAEDAVLLNGKLQQVEPGAVWPGVILAEAQWFNVDPQGAAHAMHYVMKHYQKYVEKAELLARKNKKQFAYDIIRDRTAQLLDQYVPKFAMPIPMKLPQLKKVGT